MQLPPSIRYDLTGTAPVGASRTASHEGVLAPGCWREPRTERVVRSAAFDTALRSDRIALTV
jgi:hypothetical protein